MHLKFNSEKFDSHLLQFQKVLGGEIINDIHLIIDNDKAKGDVYVIENNGIQFTIIDFQLKIDVVLEFHFNETYDFNTQFFGKNLIYEYDKHNPIQFSIPYGFFVFKENDKIYLDFNKGDQVQQASIYFSKDQISKEINTNIAKLTSFLYHEGEEHLRNWKRSVFNYQHVHEEFLKDWLTAKSVELFIYFKDILYQINDNEKPKINLDYEVEIVFKVKDNILENLKKKPNIADLSSLHGINITKLENIFKMMFDNTIYQFYKDARINAIKKEIEFSDKTFTELAYDYGYTDVNHFSKHFKKEFGMTPTQFKKLKK